MIIGADSVALVIRFLHRSNRPTPTYHGVRFEQFHRTVRVHLGRNDGTQVVLEINRVNRRLGAICIVPNLQRTRELLVFMAVPMKTNPYPHVFQYERAFALLKLDMRSS